MLDAKTFGNVIVTNSSNANTSWGPSQIFGDDKFTKCPAITNVGDKLSPIQNAHCFFTPG